MNKRCEIIRKDNKVREYNRIRAEDIHDRESALDALSKLSEDSYRRTKGKTLSVLEGIDLDPITKAELKQMKPETFLSL